MSEAHKILIRWGGTITQNEYGIDYEGSNSKGFKCHRLTYIELMDRIRRRMALGDEYQVSTVLFRFPSLYVPYISHWATYQVLDDVGVQFMFDTAANVTDLMYLEIYVDVERVTVPARQSVHVTRPSQPNMTSSSTAYDNTNALLDYNPDSDIQSIETSESENAGEDEDDNDELAEFGEEGPGQSSHLAPRDIFHAPSNTFFDVDTDHLVASNTIGGAGGDLSTWDQNAELQVHQVFTSKEHLLATTKQYSVRKHREYVTVESRSKTVLLECKKKSEGCPWRLRGTKKKNVVLWKISKYAGEHTCYCNTASQDHKHLDTSVIVDTIYSFV